MSFRAANNVAGFAAGVGNHLQLAVRSFGSIGREHFRWLRNPDAPTATTSMILATHVRGSGRLVLGHLAINQRQPPSDRKRPFHVLDLTTLIGDLG